MKLRRKVPGVIVLFIGVALAVSAWVSYEKQQRILLNSRNAQLSKIGALIDSKLREQSDAAVGFARALISSKTAKSLFKARDRDGLYAELAPVYQELNTNHGVDNAHFQVPPATSFLRLQNPKKFGEDLSATREMILLANSRHTAQKGIELGTSGVTIRGLIPVFDQEEQIGTFEIGFSFQPMLDALKGQVGFEFGAYVDSDKLLKATGASSPLNQSPLIGRFREVGTTNSALIGSLITAEAIESVSETSFTTINYKGEEYGVVMMPLLDFSNRKIGGITAVHNFTATAKEGSNLLIQTISGALITFALLAGVVVISINGLIVRPLSTLGAWLQKAAEGAPEATPLSMREDEIGEIAQNAAKCAAARKSEGGGA